MATNLTDAWLRSNKRTTRIIRTKARPVKVDSAVTTVAGNTDLLKESPIVCPSMDVQEAWIDYNGHMNMAYYSLVFDKCVDYVYDDLGIGVDYTKTEGGSCFALEVHVNYLQELVLGDPIKVTFQLLNWDAKRLHFFEQMYHADKGYLAATSEQIGLHVDMQERKSKPFPADVQAKLGALMALHEGLATPPQVGHVIGIGG